VDEAAAVLARLVGFGVSLPPPVAAETGGRAAGAFAVGIQSAGLASDGSDDGTER
jgi:hypothetical protein